MARSFLTAINLNKNEIQNAVAQNLASAPSSPVKGQFYYNSTGGDDTLYWWNGTQWMAAKAAAGATPAASVTTQAIGDAGTVGISTNFAREDHKHGMPTFGSSTAQTSFGQGKADGASVSVARSDHTHGTPTHVNADHSAISLSALAAPSTDLNMGGFKITNVGTPIAGTDATNKTYVDNALVGLTWKQPVRLASTTQVALSGLSAVDGTTPSVNDRILLKNQTSSTENGIWLAQTGTWTRALDADSSPELVDAAVFVAEGTTNSDSAWVQTTNSPISIGVTAITWVQFAGGGAVTAGSGLTQSGNTVNVVAANGSITVGADDIQVGYSGTGGEIGTAVTAARSDHTHDSKYVDVAGDTMTGALAFTGSGTKISVPSGVISAAGFAGAGATSFVMSNTLDISGTNAKFTASGTGSEVDLSALATQVQLPNITPTFGNHAATKTYVDTKVATAPRKYVTTCFAALSTTAVHSFNTRDVVVDVYRVASPYDTVECDVERTSITSVTVRFAVAPAAGEYQIVVIG